jgi:hypothetical protein
MNPSNPNDPTSSGAATDVPRGPESVKRERTRPRWLRVRYGILVAALVAGALSAEGSVDERAQAATDRVFRQAVLTYAAARTLDAAISLAEGTELAMEPGGVGLTVSAGEVLEPLDDIVEQFSSVMLVSATSLGLQSLFLRASAWSTLTFLLILFLLARVGVAFFRERVPSTVRRVVTAGTLLLLLARFAVPVYALGTTLLFERFLQPGQEEAVQALERTSADVRELDELEEERAEEGLIGRITGWFSDTMERLDISRRVEALRDRASRAIDHLLHLLVVFVLQTILLPLGFLWILARALTAATSR